MTGVQVVFFDIGDTLANADPNSPDRLVLKPLPGVPQVLRRLQGKGMRLGIISNTGQETTETMQRALTDAGLYPFFASEPRLLIYSSVVHLKKDSPKIFRLACKEAGFENELERCMFVGESPSERAFAGEAGLMVAASPQEAVEALHA